MSQEGYLRTELLDFILTDRKGEPVSFQIISGKFPLIGKRLLQAALQEICEERPCILTRKELQRKQEVYFVNPRNIV